MGTFPIHLSFRRYSLPLFCTIAYVETEHIQANSPFKGHSEKPDATLRHKAMLNKAAKYDPIMALFNSTYVYMSPFYHSTKKLFEGEIVSSQLLYPLEHILQKVLLTHSPKAKLGWMSTSLSNFKLVSKIYHKVYQIIAKAVFSFISQPILV